MTKKITAKPPIQYCKFCGTAYRRKLWKVAKYCCGNCCRKASYVRCLKQEK